MRPFQARERKLQTNNSRTRIDVYYTDACISQQEECHIASVKTISVFSISFSLFLAAATKRTGMKMKLLIVQLAILLALNGCLAKKGGGCGRKSTF